MADFKKRTLQLSSGKQIRLFGNSLAIGKSLCIGEGYAPNIFSCTEPPADHQPNIDAANLVMENKPGKIQPTGKTSVTMLNPYQLTEAEILDIADYSIRLWMDLKDKVRQYGVSSPKVFNREAML